MATAGGLLSEEHFLCSICLDVFTQPVSLPCGHNFCKACITRCWNSAACGLCQCPMCKDTFDARPELRVNCFISEMADQFRKSVQGKEEQERDNDDDVPQEALCEMEEPPGSSTTDRRMCATHNKSLELFCADEQQLICILCSQTNHKTHAVVFLEDECGRREKRIEETKEECDRMIRERLRKLEEIKCSAELNAELAERELSDCVDACAALAASFQGKQAALLEVMERKRREAEDEAGDLMADLEQEIADVESRSAELGRLSYADGLLDFFLQSQPCLHGPPLPVEDWSEVCIDSELCAGTAREALAEMEQAVNDGMEALIQQMEMINQDIEEELDISTDPESTDPECTNPVPTNPESTSPVPTNPECTSPVPTDPESTSPVPTNPECTSPVPTNPESTSPVPTSHESTDHVPTAPGCTNYINITPTPNNPVCNNYITITSLPNNPVCTKYVYVTVPQNSKRTNRRPKRPARNTPARVTPGPSNSLRTTNTPNNTGPNYPVRSHLPNNPGPRNPGRTNPPHYPGPKNPAHTNPSHNPGPQNTFRTNPHHNPGAQNTFRSNPPHNPGPQNTFRSNPPYNPGPQNTFRSNPPHNPGPQNTFRSNPPYNPGPQNTFRSNPHHNPGPQNTFSTNPPHNPGPQNTFRSNPHHNPGPQNTFSTNPHHNPGPKNPAHTKPPHNPGHKNPGHTSHGPTTQHAKQHGKTKK